MTKIIKCTCKNNKQDKLHGEGNRVYNKTAKPKGTGYFFRCTVCGAEV